MLGEAYVWEEVVPRGAWSGVLTTRLMSAAKNAVVRSALQEEGNVPGFVVEQLEGLGRVGDVGVRTHKTKVGDFVGGGEGLLLWVWWGANMDVVYTTN